MNIVKRSFIIIVGFLFGAFWVFQHCDAVDAEVAYTSERAAIPAVVVYDRIDVDYVDGKASSPCKDDLKTISFEFEEESGDSIIGEPMAEVEVASEPEAEEAAVEEDYGSSASYDSGYVNANVDGVWIAGSDFCWMGVHYDSGSGFSYTYYSENVLPGGGLSIPGRHVGDEGYVCDGNGNLCLASDDFPYGTVVSVPFGCGTGVVYDCGSGYGNLDVYVSW